MASFKAIDNPRLATLTGADVLGLISIGLSFGVALVGFIGVFIAHISRQVASKSVREGACRHFVG
jgi:branched-subunit amino acid ABC-type transport system permease component